MTILDSILLGVIQGLTEFLPVSSSGHLVIAQHFLKEFQQPGVLFDVVLHVGTLLAVLFFFRKEVWGIVCAFLPASRGFNMPTKVEGTIYERRKLALLIIIATVVTAVIGFTCNDAVHSLFESVEIAAMMLLITGLLLFFSDKIQGAVRREKDLTVKDSVFIGIAQGIALIPGISRSGSTIAMGIFRKMEGEAAARFSFLLSIPAIIGAAIFEINYVDIVAPAEILVYLIGMISAAITGFLTLRLLLLVVKKRNLKIFAYYCWIVGLSTLLVAWIK